MNSQQHHVAAVALLMSTLSEREREVMKQVFLGHDAATIADAQQVTVNTVEAQRARALKKMGARNSVQLAALVKGAKSYHLKRYIQRLQVAQRAPQSDRKSTRLNSSHVAISYAVFCLKKKNKIYSQDTVIHYYI